MSSRRAFLAGITALLAPPVTTQAQQTRKVYRVGFMFSTSPLSEMVGSDPIHPLARVFVHELRALGYRERHNLILERRSAEGKFERFGTIVAELVRLNADVILTTNNEMTLAAKTVTSTVPIVMSGSSDPVRAGLVASLARPGGNVTGLSSDTEPENEAKRLELLKEAIPRISRVAYLGTKADWVSPLGQAARRAAQSLGVTVLHAEHTPSDYISAFALIERERPDAVFAALNTPTYANRELIVGFVLKGQLPAMFPFRELVEAGGLMSYGVDVTEPWRRAAHYVDRILKGANPAELPVERPTKFELVINLKTARALGLSIPPLLLGRVDQLIE